MDIQKRIETYMVKNPDFGKKNAKLDDEIISVVLMLRERGFTWDSVLLLLKEEFNISVSQRAIAVRIAVRETKKRTPEVPLLFGETNQELLISEQPTKEQSNEIANSGMDFFDVITSEKAE